MKPAQFRDCLAETLVSEKDLMVERDGRNIRIKIDDDSSAILGQTLVCTVVIVPRTTLPQFRLRLPWEGKGAPSDLNGIISGVKDAVALRRNHRRQAIAHWWNTLSVLSVLETPLVALAEIIAPYQIAFHFPACVDKSVWMPETERKNRPGLSFFGCDSSWELIVSDRPFRWRGLEVFPGKNSRRWGDESLDDEIAKALAASNFPTNIFEPDTCVKAWLEKTTGLKPERGKTS